MTDHIITRIKDASAQNNTELVKHGLKELGLIKDTNVFLKIFDKFKDLGRNIADRDFGRTTPQFLINDLFVEAAKFNNVEICNYLINSKELKLHVNLGSTRIWLEAIRTGHLDVVKCLATNLSGENVGNIITNGLEEAGHSNNNLDVLKYLIDDPTMPHYQKVRQSFQNLHIKNSRSFFPIFIQAADRNNKSWIDFLLNHDFYKKLIDKDSFSEAINAACANNHVDMVDYLIRDEKMPYRMYDDYDSNVLLVVAARDTSMTMVNYLIMDLRIKTPENCDELFMLADFTMLTRSKNSTPIGLGGHRMVVPKSYEDMVEAIKRMFESRDLHDSLQNKLEQKTIAPSTKRKI